MSILRPNKLLRFPAIIGTRADIVPTWPVELDRTHPLAQGLVACNIGTSLTDLVTKTKFTPRSGFSFGSNVRGPAYNQTAESGGVYCNVQPSWKITTAGSLFWVGSVVGTPDASALYIGDDYDNAGDNPYVTAAIGYTSLVGPPYGLIFLWNGGGNFYGNPTGNPSLALSGVCSTLASFTVGGTINHYASGALYNSATWTGGAPNYTATSIANIGGDNNSTTRSIAGYTNGAMRWNRALSATDAAWINAEPFAMLRPIIRRSYYTPPSVTSFAPSWLLEWL